MVLFLGLIHSQNHVITSKYPGVGITVRTFGHPGYLCLTSMTTVQSRAPTFQTVEIADTESSPFAIPEIILEFIPPTKYCPIHCVFQSPKIHVVYGTTATNWTETRRNLKMICYPERRAPCVKCIIE